MDGRGILSGEVEVRAVRGAARWYASYGGLPLNNKPLTLVMSLATFAADLKAADQL